MVKHQPVGAITDRKLPQRDTTGLRTTGQRLRVKHIPYPRLPRSDQPVTPLVAQALAIFQPAQLFHHVERDMTVRTDAPAPFLRQIVNAGENTVAKVRFMSILH